MLSVAALIKVEAVATAAEMKKKSGSLVPLTHSLSPLAFLASFLPLKLTSYLDGQL